MITPLRVANEQITAALRARDERERHRNEAERRIRQADRLITACEELLLMGEEWAPEAMERSFRDLAGERPSPDLELPAGATIVRLMDALFRLQEGIFDGRINRAAYPDPD